MTKEEIFAKVKGIVADRLGVEEDQVTWDARFVEDLGADELDEVELLMAYRENFGVLIPDDLAAHISGTVGAVVDYLYHTMR